MVPMELTNIFDTTRQTMWNNIHKKITKNTIFHNIWSRDILTYHERTLIFGMCTRKELFFEEGNITFLRIYRIKKEYAGVSSKYAIFTRNDDNIIKYSKTLDKQLINKLDDSGYDKYSEKDFEVIRYMYSNPDAYSIEGETIDIIDDKFKKIINSGRSKTACKIKGISNYVKFLTGYNYKTISQKFKQQNRDETLALYRNELTSHYIINNNKIFMLQQDPLRNRMQAYASKHKADFNNLVGLLKYMEFELVSKQQLPVGYIPYDFSKKRTDEDILASLEDIQGSAGVSSTTTQKVNRNQDLVKELKELYKYKCQFCNYEEEGKYIPLIEKEENVYYMEAHHIIKISEAKMCALKLLRLLI